MAAVVLIAVVAIVLAVLLAALLPGAGLVVAAFVLAAGIAAIVWMLMAARTGRAPSETIQAVDSPDHLGPGGPDDPNR
jgi:hypothetical protein